MRSRRSDVIARLVLVLITGACAERGEPDLALEMAGPLRLTGAPGWSIDAQPAFEIGEEEGEPHLLFSRIAGATRLSDGRIVVGDGASNQLRFFDADGAYLFSVGREGQGPGEFEYLRALGRCAGDSLSAFDLNHQMSTFDAEGNFHRRIVFRPDGRTPYGLACGRAGVVVMIGWGARAFAPTDRFTQSRSPVLLADREGNVLSELGDYLASERLNDPGGSRPHPFGRATVLGVASDRVYVGSSERFAFDVFDLQGNRLRTLEGPPVDLTVRPEHMEAYRAEVLATARPEARPAWEREFANMPMVDALPAYSDLLIDPLDLLWVKRFPLPGDSVFTWVILSPDAQHLGTLSTPRDHTLREVGADYLLVTVKDELDVERVRLYTLRRQARTR